MHSLVVTQGFPGGGGDKRPASEGSYFPVLKHTGPLRSYKGGEGVLCHLSVLANYPVLVERKCSGYISFHHKMPPPVI